MPKEKFNRLRPATFGLLPQITYRIKVNDESRQRIADLSDLLVSRPELSFVLYANHISLPDPLFETHIVDRLDPQQSRHLIAPVSHSHTDPTKLKNIPMIMLVALAKCSGTEIIRIIQQYEVNNPLFTYTQPQATITHRKWLKRLQELGKSKIPTGVFINPEGTRSETGVLADGENSIVTAGRLLAPALFIPLGIYYDQNFSRKGVNLGKRVNLNIGHTYLQETKTDSPDLDTLMTNLAATLPIKMRGKWQN